MTIFDLRNLKKGEELHDWLYTKVGTNIVEYADIIVTKTKKKYKIKVVNTLDFEVIFKTSINLDIYYSK